MSKGGLSIWLGYLLDASLEVFWTHPTGNKRKILFFTKSWALCVLQADRPVWSGVSGWGVPPVSSVDERQRHHRHPGPHFHRQWGGFRPGQCVCFCICLSLWITASAIYDLVRMQSSYFLNDSIMYTVCFLSDKLSLLWWLVLFTRLIVARWQSGSWSQVAPTSRWLRRTRKII